MTASTELELSQPANGSLPAKLEYARFLAASGMLPVQYREKPANILWATEYGEMLGLRPMAAITGIHVIEGKPSASAALISALVRRAGHRLRVSGDDEKAVVEIVRSDDPEFVFRVEWTLARARTAGLTGKSVWKNYPAAMLKARAVSECARDACEEALLGMHYTPEELGAEVDAEGTPIRATATPAPARPVDPDWASKPATAQERATGQPETGLALDDDEWSQVITAAVEQRDADELRNLWRQAKRERPNDVDLRERIAAASKALTEPAAEQPPAPADDEPIDAELVDDEPADPQKQHRHMHALWNKADVSREERLAITSHLIGRDIESSKDLTGAEADLVIERLRAFDAVGKDALQERCEKWLEDYAARAAAPSEQDGAES